MGKRRKRLTMPKYARKYASIRQTVARLRGEETGVVAATTTTTTTAAQPILATPTEEVTLKNVAAEKIEVIEAEAAAPEVEQVETVPTEAKLVATAGPTTLVDANPKEETTKTTKSAKSTTSQAQVRSNKSTSKKTTSKKPTRKAQKATAKKTSSKSTSARG